MPESLSEQVAALEARLAEVERERDDYKRAMCNANDWAGMAEAEAKDAQARLASARVEGARPDWEFPQMDDPDAQLVVMSFRDDHEWTAKVIHRQSRQFVTMADIQREYPAPAAPAGEARRPNLGVPFTRCKACDSLRDWEGRCDDCDGPRPAPTPEPEPLPIRVKVTEWSEGDEDRPFDGVRTHRAVDLTPEDCRRIVALGSRPTQTAEG